jgi:hypothetical protein
MKVEDWSESKRDMIYMRRSIIESDSKWYNNVEYKWTGGDRRVRSEREQKE